MSVQPFRIDVPQSVLDRIQAKLSDARIGYMPDRGNPWQYGTDARYLAQLVDYWRTAYDWRAEESKLNRWPQYQAQIDGVQIHFYHVQSDIARRPVPILLTHGWPGSVVEFQDVIPRLLNAGFSVVVPSLPGYGWSARPAVPIGPARVAAMWRALMVDCLGYSRFFAQGGDWGSAVTTQLGISHADVVAAIHLNFFMPPLPGPDADAELLAYWADVGKAVEEEGGYQHEHGTKPQTIGLALHDNPVGWAAWVIEKFWGWGDKAKPLEQRFSKDQLITNLMSYLTTDTVMSSIWMYNGLKSDAMAQGRVEVPTALAHFPHEFYPMPDRRLAERQYNVVRMTSLASGGHFAAMEEPEAFSQDVIEFFSHQA